MQELGPFGTMRRQGVRRLGGWLGAAWLAGAPLFAAEGTSPLELARQLNQAFIEVADRVSPSVVVLRVAHRADYDAAQLDEHPFFQLPPEMKKRFQEEMEKRRKERQQRGPVYDSDGSGIILREDGYILTNSHVVDGAEKILVQLKDGREFEDAKVVGVDPQSEVAVLRVTAQGLPAAKLGDSSKSRVGEFAIAIGAPFNLDYSVTFGHISAKGRRVMSSQFMWDQDFIQTDASINPGNSGGPLVNIEGEVIGINTMIRGLNSGIGFAVPVNLAREVSDQLIRKGRYTRAVLGVEIRTLALDKEYRNLVPGLKEGVVVRRILPWSPVLDSELEAGDVIIAVDGKPVATSDQLQAEVRTKEVGRPVTLDVQRGEKKLVIKVKPGELPSGPEGSERARAEGAPPAGWFGLKVETLNQKRAEEFGIDSIPGVVVTEVERGSLAEEKGVLPGDVITEVNRRKITSSADFQSALKGADVGKGVLLKFAGKQGRRVEVFKDGQE